MKLLGLCAVLVVLLVPEEVQSSGVTIGLTPYSQPVVQAQYQNQDAYGQYVYGYATGTSSKSEVKTADGVTRGGYSYIDSNGLIQTVHYVSDPINGFRVAATNLPVDLPEVALEKARHIAQYIQTKAEHDAIAAQHLQGDLLASSVPQAIPVSLPVQDLSEVTRARLEHLATYEYVRARDAELARQALLSPVPATLSSGHIVPIKTRPSPVIVSTSYAPASQHQSQDALGQYTYGYVTPLSSKGETKTADGITRGGYSYIDANGIVQSVNYVSDPINGFRVAATNIPVGPAEIANAKVLLSPSPAIQVPTAIIPNSIPAPVVETNALEPQPHIVPGQTIVFGPSEIPESTPILAPSPHLPPSLLTNVPVGPIDFVTSQGPLQPQLATSPIVVAEGTQPAEASPVAPSPGVSQPKLIDVDIKGPTGSYATEIQY